MGIARPVLRLQLHQFQGAPELGRCKRYGLVSYWGQYPFEGLLSVFALRLDTDPGGARPWATSEAVGEKTRYQTWGLMKTTPLDPHR